MKRLPSLITPLALAAMLACGHAHAQARGPAAEVVRETGQEVLGPVATLARESQEEEQLDDATRAKRFADLQAWLSRLYGRFRIDGQIESKGQAGRPTGVADCDEVGDGAGVQCIINANWPFFENSPINQVALPPAEALNTMRPAMLILGLSQAPLGIRAMLVPADSLAHSWVGRLDENTLDATDEPERLGTVAQMPVTVPGAGDTTETLFDSTPLAGDPADCTDRCMRWFEVIARPGSEIVTFQFQGSGVTIKFIMHRDPDAKADQPMKSMKAR